MGAEFQITIKSNAKELARDIQLFAEDQLPYATSRALNRLGAIILDEERDLMASRFAIRSKWMLRAFRLIRTHKSQWPGLAVVGGHQFWAMKLHELGGQKTGGTKHPGEIYVPTRAIAAMRSPTTGRLPAALYPQALLDSNRAYFTKNEFFGEVIKARTGAMHSTALLRRATKDGKEPVLYLVRNSAKILARFGFGPEAIALAGRLYEEIFEQEMTNAVRTSKHYAATAARILETRG
jgi:hypothetical protein